MALMLQSKSTVLSIRNQADGNLHDAVPVVPGGDPEQRQEGHAEVLEVRVLAEALTRMQLRTFFTQRQTNSTAAAGA